MNAPRGRYLTALLDDLVGVKSWPMSIVETGCIRQDTEQYRIGDGWSTLYLAGWAAKHGARFRSFETNPIAIDMASKILRAYSLEKHVEFVEGDAATELKKLNEPLDFVYLDSSSDQNVNFREFTSIHPLLRLPAIVVIDDCFGMSDQETKGKITMEFVKERSLAKIFKLDRMAVIPFAYAPSYADLVQ